MVAVPAAPDPYYEALMSGVDSPELADLLDRPAFMADALCREHPEIDFFPERGEPLDPARRVCARCLVRAECLGYAMRTVERDGVWGGTSARQRNLARNAGLSAEDVLFELDSRVGPSVEPNEPVGVLVIEPVSAIADVPALRPDPAMCACSSCEELVPVAEMVYEHWCARCW